MNRANPFNWWRSFLAMPNTHPLKAVGVVFLVALTCSFAVSLTAITLKPLQDANRLSQSAASLVEVLEALDVGLPKVRMVELATGAYAKRDPGTWIEIASGQDIAGVGELETIATVYEVYQDDRLQLVILPVRGLGYKSTLKGYLSLRGDLSTVAALSFHEHNETPGMGARIEENEWQALWADKLVFDEGGVIRIEVVKGEGVGVHEVDGISGATRTGSGVTNLVQFWLGPNGYGPYLERLKEEGAE